uniref:EGF-like domain-containing protein n=1 Tax=Strongyloides stercoralis TaxID=6248 RepID=A0AAF5DMA1_STRER
MKVIINIVLICSFTIFLNAGIFKRETTSDFAEELTTVTAIFDNNINDSIINSVEEEKEIFKNETQTISTNTDINNESSGDIGDILNDNVTKAVDILNESDQKVLEEGFISFSSPIKNYSDEIITSEEPIIDDTTVEPTIETPLNEIVTVEPTIEIPLNEIVTMEPKIIDSIKNNQTCSCSTFNHSLSLNNVSISFNLTNFINTTFSPTIILSPTIMDENKNKELPCNCECMCKLEQLLNQTKTTDSITTTEITTISPETITEITTISPEIITEITTISPEIITEITTISPEIITEITTISPETTTFPVESKKQRQCKCFCDKNKLIYPLHTTTPTLPSTTAYRSLPGKFCKCICDKDILSFDEPLMTTTTTMNPPTVNTNQPIKRKLCRCECKKETFLDKPLTTTVKSAKRKLCKCKYDNEEFFDQPATTTSTTTTKVVTDKLEEKKCIKHKKCYSNEDCNKGSCIGAFVGTCNCNACFSGLYCKNDSQCGGLIGSCDVTKKRCDCQKAHSMYGFPKYIDVLNNFCHKRKCDGKIDTCNGLPCYSGICIC